MTMKTKMEVSINQIPSLMSVLPGCAALAALAKGKEIHAYAIRNLLASDGRHSGKRIGRYVREIRLLEPI